MQMPMKVGIHTRQPSDLTSADLKQILKLVKALDR